MKPAAVLKELGELKEAWRKQSFSYTNEQKKRREELLKLRHARVKWFHDNDRVQKGPKKTVEKEKKEEET